MLMKYVFAGFGGQGVLSMGAMLAYAAMEEKKEATFMPSYGPEMRGGTANCHVVVSDKSIASPLVAAPDILVVMNKPSLAKFEEKVKPGGIIVINSDVCDEKVKRTDVKTYYVPCLKTANELGNAKASNTVMLGALMTINPVVSDENILKAMDYQFKTKPKLYELNHKAYHVGKELIK